ncbi:MAG: DUF3552 domain-containing protein, partial [Chloroflexi bacterium]|nr:DUF3552 domain-containing protein [Chloroflexota bacterium]
MDIIVAVLVALGLGTAGGFFVRVIIAQRGQKAAQNRTSAIIAQGEEAKKRLLLEGQEEALKLRTAAEQELRDRRTVLQRQERRLSHRDEQLLRRNEALERRERASVQKEQDLEVKEAQLEEFKGKQQAQLEAISGLSVNDAKELLMRRAEEEIQYELARRYRDMEEQAKEEADQKARRIVTLSIQRLASDVVSETTTAVVPLPNDEMKGRLIGREGRNIRA